MCCGKRRKEMKVEFKADLETVPLPHFPCVSSQLITNVPSSHTATQWPLLVPLNTESCLHQWLCNIAVNDNYGNHVNYYTELQTLEGRTRSPK